jgi:hypothetical protein
MVAITPALVGRMPQPARATAPAVVVQSRAAYIASVAGDLLTCAVYEAWMLAVVVIEAVRSRLHPPVCGPRFF